MKICSKAFQRKDVGNSLPVVVELTTQRCSNIEVSNSSVTKGINPLITYSPFLFTYISYRSCGEKLLKYQ